MSMNVNGEYNRIECNYPMLYVPETKKYYLDFSSLAEISGLPNTCLFRVLKTMPELPVYRYKNRVYYELTFCLQFHQRNIKTTN